MKNKPLFSDQYCADRLKALSDPTRFSVLRALMLREMRVGELEAELCIEQSLLSHHLRILREAQLVQSKRQGKSVVYSLADGLIKEPGSTPSEIDLSCCKLLIN